ncbi:MAG: glycoside hydrolase family 9 protein, partial [Vibrio sp.]
SKPFTIKDDLLYQGCFSDLLHYFKSNRSSGIWDEADRNALIFGSSQRKDVHGGWYDASGDVSKYLSHLSYANYFNPQQIPALVWILARSYDELTRDPNFQAFPKARLKEEALFGADFLCRMQDPTGFFYMTVFDKWSKDPKQRELCAYQTQAGEKLDSYQAGFRQGGGMSIAALAHASKLAESEMSDTYWQAAHLGYQHLIQHNCDYLDDGQENIIDAYCALLAATALAHTAQHKHSRHFTYYQEQANQWAQTLCQYLQSDQNYDAFWSASSDGSRPYFHAAEAGLPVIALTEYFTLCPPKDSNIREQVQLCIAKACLFELEVTSEINNPFAYPRQYVKACDSEKVSDFFIPQHNETGYWWQGENARLASLSAMGYQVLTYMKSHANPILSEQTQVKLTDYSGHNLDWILGRNPFDICMLDGHGHNNPDYLPELGFFNAKGGVCNGITAGFGQPQAIAFNPEPYGQDMEQNWRWGEQWLPHAAWLFYASVMQHMYHLSTQQNS